MHRDNEGFSCGHLKRALPVTLRIYDGMMILDHGSN